MTTWSCLLDGLTGRREWRHLRRELALAQVDVRASSPETIGPEGAQSNDDDEAALGGDPPLGLISRAVIAEARAQWVLGVSEPPGTGVESIRRYIYEGLGWPAGRWPYEADGDFAWCGAFVAWCYRAAGLRASVRRRHLASTYRLHEWSRNGSRRLKPEDLQAGDIAIVGRKGSRWGDHVVICGGPDKSRGIRTIEGNAKGGGPGSVVHEGVVVQRRPWAENARTGKEYRVLYGVRPLAEDYSDPVV